MKTTLLLLFLAFCCPVKAQETAGDRIKKGDPCNSKEELAGAPGTYLTAAQYPWPAVRAAYFEKMSTSADKTAARQSLEQIEKLEQQSRSHFALTGGTWEGYYSTEGYHYAGMKRLADYRFQVAFHEFLCINKKTARNGEYSTVLRVYVNSLPLNALAAHLTHAFPDNLGDYAYHDPKNYKAGVPAPKINLLNYLAEKTKGLVDAINSGDRYWQDTPENKIAKNTYNPIYRCWFIKKANIPLLIPVSRKEYLESLLEYYEREKLYILITTQSVSPENIQKKYGGDWKAVIEAKKAKVNQVLKENSAPWLAGQAIVNPDEDFYQNQKQKLPEYSSLFTFRRFYDGEEKSVPLYQYNPACLPDKTQNAAAPQFITINFRYVPKPVHLRLIDNFTTNFDRDAWEKLLH